MNKDFYIQQFNLKAHPEGGHYAEVYRAPNTVISPLHQQPRAALTHIYFLLGAGERSRFHKVAHDEVWNYYAGAPLQLITYAKGDICEQQLGPGQAHFTAVVPGGVYQAAKSSGDFTLVGCSVAPGFDFADFSFLVDDDPRAKQHTALAPYIAFL